MNENKNNVNEIEEIADILRANPKALNKFLSIITENDSLKSRIKEISTSNQALDAKNKKLKIQIAHTKKDINDFVVLHYKDLQEQLLKSYKYTKDLQEQLIDSSKDTNEAKKKMSYLLDISKKILEEQEDLHKKLTYSNEIQHNAIQTSFKLSELLSFMLDSALNGVELTDEKIAEISVKQSTLMMPIINYIKETENNETINTEIDLEQE